MIEFKTIMPPNGSIERQAWASLKKQIERKFNAQLKKINCPDHNQSPKLIVTGSVGKPKLDIRGCCKKLEDMAKDAWDE
ncbi:MAG: hypothetical protein KAH97_02305 [Anaerolineales bacterium]|nr:hypothetical protein [Anaerolineales bacterium]